ncbi:radical SAM family heme chaperone HemW [Peptostreptococcus equinus]|uniref:Heme chaperone HemW n=1 Tax=Peptostreptococcus equinus TaxID=3003601 RepID=A0ABY7JMX2_9FIRM|nr:radical SAM family heme chaperone HemW [Peptostreptococcus sp. CBA3647]WAW14196.1 radical SAM family heme chaperone HemW [Peptostreptococcus sp. CBA3647]
MKDRGLYIHIPFCAKKCHYCDFTSYVGMESEIDSYLEALKREIDLYLVEKKLVSSIFIGGGTPSILSVKQIEKLLKIINKKFIFDINTEFTIECNPGTLTIEKLRVMKEMGINRLSIGLQSTHDKHLEFMGRIHNLKEFEESFKNARQVGFDNINVDLIFAFEGQTFDEWKETVNYIINLNPEHISAYSLIIEEGTRFFYLYEQGQLKEIDEELYVKMYRYVIDTFEKNGYEQYEISNYAKKDRRCKHNILYWECEEYYGFGLGASGYIEGIRYTNTKNMTQYMKKIEKNNKPIDYEEKLSNIDIYNERMMLGLRMIEGIDMLQLMSLLDDENKKIIESKIRKYIEQGHIKKYIINGDEYIHFCQQGIEISNTILVDLMI